MSIKEQILNDIKSAMKSQNAFERDTLRMINSAFKQIEVDERVELDDARIFTILQSEIKRRNDSATQYKNGGRDDLAQKELGEIEIISRYLPKQLSDDELKAKISELIAQNRLNGIKDFDKFFAAVDKCEGRVELVTSEGDRLNLKSKLAQYVSLAKIFSNGEMKNEIELLCYNPNDIKNLMEYMIG